MRWTDVRAAFPGQWLIIDAVHARTEGQRRLVEDIAVIEPCSDGGMAFRRYRELRRQHADRELYFVHTANAELEIEERSWIGIRGNHAPDPSR